MTLSIFLFLFFLVLPLHGLRADVIDNVALLYRATYEQADNTVHKWGEEQLNGADLAVDYFQKFYPKFYVRLKKIGYSNKPLSIQKAIKEAQKDEIDFFTGIPWSNDILEALPLIAQKNNNILSAMATSSRLSSNQRVISIAPSNEDLIKILFSNLRKRKILCNQFHIAYAADDEYSLDLLEIIGRNFQSITKGDHLNTVAFLTKNTTIPKDLMNHLDNLKEDDCLFVASPNEFEAGTIIGHIAKENMPLVLGSDSFGESGSSLWPLVPEKKRKFVQGYSVFPWSLENTDPLFNAFLNLHKKRYTSYPEGMGFYTFKAVLASLLIRANYSGSKKIPISDIIKDPTVREHLQKHNIEFTQDGYGKYPISTIYLKAGQHIRLEEKDT